jgi:excisionase family DNA binding protein
MGTLLTTQEAAERLGLTDSRVRQLVLEGKLPAQKFGRAHVIREEDLELVADIKRGRPPKADKKPEESRKKTKGK